MKTFWKTIFEFAFAPLCFGGDSSSSTKTETTFNTRDERIAAAEGAVVSRLENSDVTGGGAVLKFTGDNNTIETADPRIVAAAFEFAKNKDASAGVTIENVLSRQTDAFLQSSAQARGAFSERTILILGGGVLLLLFGFMRARKA